jgi:hypothetical protein
MIRAAGAGNDAVILPGRPLMRAHGADCRRPIDACGHESAMAAHDDDHHWVYAALAITLAANAVVAVSADTGRRVRASLRQASTIRTTTSASGS